MTVMSTSFSADLSSSDDDSPNPAASRLVDRAHALLDSVDALQRHLRRNSLDKEVEIRTFATSLRSELRILESLAATPPAPDAAPLLTSNLTHLELIWKYTRTQLGVRGISKSFSYPPSQCLPPATHHQRSGKKEKKISIAVDVVSQNGLTWTKVSAITPSRILRTEEVALVRVVEGYLCAARNVRVQYLHPEVVVYLPNVRRSDDGVAGFVGELVALGAAVRLGDDDLVRPKADQDQLLGVEEMVKTVVNTTDVVNLDVTVLLALVSEITHGPVVSEERFHPAILRQVEMEEAGRRMGEMLGRVLGGGKELVATKTAVGRFCEIVGILGSNSEKRRMELLLGGEGTGGEWDVLSVYGFGGERLRLPVRVIDDDVVLDGEVQTRVLGKLSRVNRAVFMTGWKKGFTTVTSNRTVAKVIEGLIQDGERGPDMFVLGTSRSLVGKAKRIDV